MIYEQTFYLSLHISSKKLEAVFDLTLFKKKLEGNSKRKSKLKKIISKILCNTWQQKCNDSAQNYNKNSML